MKSAINYARGIVCVEVECRDPTRFLNVCAQNGIEFWQLNRISGTVVTAHMRVEGYRRLVPLADRAGFSLKQIKSAGAPVLLQKIRKRYVLLSGMALCLLAVHVTSLFVWELEVIGNKSIPARLILENLCDLGVGIGSFGPPITTSAISNEMILRIPELSWIAVNVRGSRAQVLVRERIPKPEIIDPNRPVMVYAAASGEIIRMNVLQGRKELTVGDMVNAGDVIVSGIMDSLSYGRRVVHAMAEVYARTWYEMSAKMPLETVIKQHTGNVVTRRAVNFMGRRINLFFNGRISLPYYDKITSRSILRLPTGRAMPLMLITEEYAEYMPILSALSVSDAETILQESLLTSLRETIGGGKIVSAQFTTQVSGGVVTVTLIAECVEQIAAARDFTEEELGG